MMSGDGGGERVPAGKSSDVREEVLNVILADLLSSRGLLSIPEIIRRSSRGRTLPDVTIGDIRGVRVVIEGRVDSSSSIRASLLTDARKRVEQGIAPICLAVLYPSDLRSVKSLAQLRKDIAKAELAVCVVWEGGETEWATGGLDEMTDILRRSYELLVGEDVVATAVAELNDAIETASESIATASAAPEKLRKLLGIPEETEPNADDDEEVED
jgi:hypothetical protein